MRKQKKSPEDMSTKETIDLLLKQKEHAARGSVRLLSAYGITIGAFMLVGGLSIVSEMIRDESTDSRSELEDLRLWAKLFSQCSTTEF